MFINIFGEKFNRNPNLLDVELMSTDIKVIKNLITDYLDTGATDEEKAWIFNPILARLDEAISEENKKKSYEKSIIKGDKIA